MTKSEALASGRRTYAEETRGAAGNESDVDFIERLLDLNREELESYNAVQREFGWDDTH